MIENNQDSCQNGRYLCENPIGLKRVKNKYSDTGYAAIKNALNNCHDRCGPKITRNSVLYCHLSPAGQQMTIKNSVSNYFYLHSLRVSTFLIAGHPLWICYFQIPAPPSDPGFLALRQELVALRSEKGIDVETYLETKERIEK